MSQVRENAGTEQSNNFLLATAIVPDEGWNPKRWVSKSHLWLEIITSEVVSFHNFNCDSTVIMYYIYWYCSFLNTFDMADVDATCKETTTVINICSW